VPITIAPNVVADEFVAPGPVKAFATLNPCLDGAEMRQVRGHKKENTE
jgi:hypothetical protein